MQPPLPFFLSNKCKDYSDESVSRGILKAIQPLENLKDFSAHSDTKCPYGANSQCYKLMVKLAQGESFTNGQAQGTLHASSGDRRIRQVRAKLKDLGIDMAEEWINTENARYKRFYLDTPNRIKLNAMIQQWA